MSIHPNATVVAAHAMERDFLNSYPNLFVKQTKKGCLMELCCGCDANTEFKIATMENTNQDIMYATENTSCCIRFFCGPLRPFTIAVSEGGERGGKVHSLHQRPCAFPLACGKCCCYQEINVQTPTGAPIGKVLEDYWFFVPNFHVLDASQNVQYYIHQPTCLDGLCVNIFYDTTTWTVPFHIYEPGKENEGEHVGQVVKIWSDMRTEMFTDADKFELRFPANADAQTKTRLLGVLINQLFFENKRSKNNGHH